jgi:hypothetical protein
MALVVRNGRMYAYRSIRVGGKVTSRYVASGPLALSLAALAAEEQAQAQADRALRRQLRELDQATAALAAGVLAEVGAVLEGVGYHRPGRHWRKRRGHREPTSEG